MQLIKLMAEFKSMIKMERKVKDPRLICGKLHLQAPILAPDDDNGSDEEVVKWDGETQSRIEEYIGVKSYGAEKSQTDFVNRCFKV